MDIVLTPSYHLLPQMMKDLNTKKNQINTDFIINEKFDYLNEQSRPHVSSFVTIQRDDKFCSFCVVLLTEDLNIQGHASIINGSNYNE